MKKEAMILSNKSCSKIIKASFVLESVRHVLHVLRDQSKI